jgi:hypothetical protein
VSDINELDAASNRLQNDWLRLARRIVRDEGHGRVTALRTVLQFLLADADDSQDWVFHLDHHRPIFERF